MLDTLPTDTSNIISFIVGFLLGLFGRVIHVFKIQDIYERQRQHQKELFNSLNNWLAEPEIRISVAGVSYFDCPGPIKELENYLLQHIESGYPQAAGLIKEVQKLHEDCTKLRKELVENVRRVVTAKFEEYGDLLSRTPYDVNNFVNCVLFEMENKLKINKEEKYLNLQIENKTLKINATEVARSQNKSVLEKLMKFYYEILQTEEFLKIGEEILRLQEEYRNKKRELMEILHDLANRLNYGDKMGGECDVCPKLLKNLKPKLFK